MPTEEQRQAIAESLDGIVADGERFVVDCHDGRIEVQEIEDADLRPLAEEKPELYGHLLAVSEVLSDAGASLVVFSMLLVAAICLTVHMQWIDTFLRVDIEHLRSIWVYGFALAASFFVVGQIAVWVEAAAYRRHREELIQSIHRAGIGRWHLLARIAEDEQLENVADHMKKDARPWE